MVMENNMDKSISKTFRRQLKREVTSIFKEITENFSNRQMMNLINTVNVTREKRMRKARR